MKSTTFSVLKSSTAISLAIVAGGVTYTGAAWAQGMTYADVSYDRSMERSFSAFDDDYNSMAEHNGPLPTIIVSGDDVEVKGSKGRQTYRNDGHSIKLTRPKSKAEIRAAQMAQQEEQARMAAQARQMKAMEDERKELLKQKMEQEKRLAQLEASRLANELAAAKAREAAMKAAQVEEEQRLTRQLAEERAKIEEEIRASIALEMKAKALADLEMRAQQEAEALAAERQRLSDEADRLASARADMLIEQEETQRAAEGQYQLTQQPIIVSTPSAERMDAPLEIESRAAIKQPFVIVHNTINGPKPIILAIKDENPMSNEGKEDKATIAPPTSLAPDGLRGTDGGDGKNKAVVYTAPQIAPQTQKDENIKETAAEADLNETPLKPVQPSKGLWPQLSGNKTKTDDDPVLPWKNPDEMKATPAKGNDVAGHVAGDARNVTGFIAETIEESLLELHERPLADHDMTRQELIEEINLEARKNGMPDGWLSNPVADGMDGSRAGGHQESYDALNDEEKTAVSKIAAVLVDGRIDHLNLSKPSRQAIHQRLLGLIEEGDMPTPYVPSDSPAIDRASGSVEMAHNDQGNSEQEHAPMIEEQLIATFIDGAPDSDRAEEQDNKADLAVINPPVDAVDDQEEVGGQDMADDNAERPAQQQIAAMFGHGQSPMAINYDNSAYETYLKRGLFVEAGILLPLETMSDFTDGINGFGRIGVDLNEDYAVTLQVESRSNGLDDAIGIFAGTTWYPMGRADMEQAFYTAAGLGLYRFDQNSNGAGFTDTALSIYGETGMEFAVGDNGILNPAIRLTIANDDMPVFDNSATETLFRVGYKIRL